MARDPVVVLDRSDSRRSGFTDGADFSWAPRMCPSSKHLGHQSLFLNGGSGSSWFDVKPLDVDGSSGGCGWLVS